MSPHTVRVDVDQARLLPHLRLIQHQAAAFQHAYHDAGPAIDRRTPHHRTPAAHVGSPGDLRGIPVIAPGVGGAQPGTQPEGTTIRRLA